MEVLLLSLCCIPHLSPMSSGMERTPISPHIRDRSTDAPAVKQACRALSHTCPRHYRIRCSVPAFLSQSFKNVYFLGTEKRLKGHLRGSVGWLSTMGSGHDLRDPGLNSPWGSLLGSKSAFPSPSALHPAVFSLSRALFLSLK